MKKLTWILVAVFIVSCVLLCGMAPAYAEEADTKASEPRYVDANLIVAAAGGEQIHFTSRDITNVTTDGGAPTYYNNFGKANSCGPIAGTEITFFYDKYYDNLIPGWQCYYPASGYYRMADSTYIEPVFLSMYDLMKCNVVDEGVSEAEFKSGLQTYFKNQGYSLSYQTATKNSTLNWDTCVSAINNNKVVVLFVTPGKMYGIQESSNYHTLTEYNITGNHIMVAYGYIQIKYYNNGVNFRTETFVTVATGLAYPTTAYYKINSDNLDAAYVVNVA